MRISWLALLCGVLWACASGASAATPPWPRTANHTLRLPDRVPVSGYALVDAFPGLLFAEPVAIAAVPGETNRLFVVERSGIIQVITNLARPTKTVFLDLSSRIESDNIESGLLGLAFHPEFAVNRRFFLYWTGIATTPGAADRMHDIVARFEASALSRALSAASFAA